MLMNHKNVVEVTRQYAALASYAKYILAPGGQAELVKSLNAGGYVTAFSEVHEITSAEIILTVGDKLQLKVNFTYLDGDVIGHARVNVNPDAKFTAEY